MHATGTGECFERWRRCSLISSGPVAQLRPIASTPERLERRERGADLAAHEHGAGRLDGHLDEDRKTDAAADDRLTTAVDRGLRLQQVLRGLDEEGVRAAVDEPLGLQRERLLEVLVGRVAEARELGARPHRPQHPAHAPVGGLGRLDPLARDAGARLGELRDPVLDAVVAEVRPVRAERVRLDGVDADREVLVVDRADHVGARDVEDLVAALELEVVLERRLVPLQHRAHRAVRDHDAGLHGVEQRLRPERTRDPVDVEREAGCGGGRGHSGDSTERPAPPARSLRGTAVLPFTRSWRPASAARTRRASSPSPAPRTRA